MFLRAILLYHILRESQAYETEISYRKNLYIERKAFSLFLYFKALNKKNEKITIEN